MGRLDHLDQGAEIVTIASGFAGYDILAFTVLSIITRGARFFIEAELLRAHGRSHSRFYRKASDPRNHRFRGCRCRGLVRHKVLYVGGA